MIQNPQLTKLILTSFIIWTFLIGSLPVKAQDLVSSGSLTGGSSVFVARKSRPKQRSYATTSRNTSRTSRSAKSTRAAARSKVRRQYKTLARVEKRRKEIKVYTPVEFLKLKRETPEQASAALTGGAQYYLVKGEELETALGMFREAISLDKTNDDAKFGYSEALTTRADEFIEKEDFINAKGFYLEALKFNEENSAAYAGLGAVYDEEGDNENAIANYEKALKIDPDLTELYAPLGILYVEQSEKNKDESEELIAKASEYLTKSLAADASNAETQYFLGLVRFKQGNYEAATKAFSRSLEIEPDKPEAHFYLGDINMLADKNVEAIAEYNKAIQLKPDYVDAWFNLGVANYALKNYPEAVRAYTEITTKLENFNGLAHANLAESYLQLKEYAFAEGSYRLATAFIKDDAELFSNLGFVTGVLGKWKSSISALEEAIRIDPDAIDYTNLGWAYYNYAKVDLKANKKEDARAKFLLGKAALEKAVELDPKLEGANLNLGITLIELEDYEAAINALEQAAILKPGWLEAINELGIAYRNANQYKAAAEQFRKTTEIKSDFAAGYFNWGEAELQQRNFKEAEKIQNKLGSLNKLLARRLAILILQEKRKK